MRRFMLAGAAALALCGAASAQDYKASYKAFVAAREAGDAAAARTHAVAAWEAARGTLEPGETLALLAQNALIEAMWLDPEAAMPMAAHALTLGEAGHGLGNMTLTELAVAEAYLRAETSGDGDDARRLAAALAADRATGRTLTPYALTAHDRAYLLAMASGRHGLAYDIVTPLVHELRASGEPLDEAIASRNILRAVALLVAGRRIDSALGRDGEGGAWSLKNRLRDAHALIDGAQQAFAPAPSLDEVAPGALDARIWHAVLSSVAGTAEVTLSGGHEFDGSVSIEGGVPVIARPGLDDEACAFEWTHREMTYPKLRRGYIGGVLIGYDLTPAGSVVNARVLGEVPEGKFGAHVLEHAKRWEAAVGEVPAACLTDQTVAIVFTLPR